MSGISCFLKTLARDAQRLYPGHAAGRALVSGLFNPRYHPVLICRLAHAMRRYPLRPAGLLLALLNMIVYRVEIALDTEIGPGLFIPHGNVIIGANRIGEDFSIFSGVVIGSRSGNLQEPSAPIGADRPVIGARVTLYSNAVVAGPVTIGNDARVAACTLVNEDVPDGIVVRPALPEFEKR